MPLGGHLYPNRYRTGDGIIALHLPVEEIGGSAVGTKDNVVSVGVLHVSAIGHGGQIRIDTLNEDGEVSLVCVGHLLVRNGDRPLITKPPAGAIRCRVADHDYNIRDADVSEVINGDSSQGMTTVA